MSRRTKSERDKERIEQAELSRRIRSGEGSSVVTPDAGVLREVADYDHALRELARHSQLPDPAPEPPACDKHNWPPPSERGHGKPHPPESMCPKCLQGLPADNGEETPPHQQGTTVWVDSPPRKKPSPELDARWNLHLELLEARGVVLAGSTQERAAVARSDDLREMELSGTHGRAGYPRGVAWASFDGSRVIYERPHRRGGGW